MPTLRWSALLVSVLVGAGCGTARVQCTAANCAGCCDANGRCEAGLQSETCGADGAACVSCATGSSCQAQVCVIRGGGGTGGGATGTGGGTGTGCTQAATLIYVVDEDTTVSSFNPAFVGQGNPFTSIGTLSCPSASGATPFSMAVDRDAQAWVVFDDGELFNVDLTSAGLPCTKTSFASQQGIVRFGMGFVADSAAATSDTLYISGSGTTTNLSSSKFGTLSTAAPYHITVETTLDGAPELTGTGDAKLWAFFPNLTTPQVRQLDKGTGASLTTFDAAALQGAPLAWAFAFWGGDFWIFLERTGEGETHVWHLDGKTGAVTDAVPVTGRHIVGAGVSTCAPITIN